MRQTLLFILGIIFFSFLVNAQFDPLDYNLPNETKTMKKLNLASRDDTISIISDSYCDRLSALPSIDGKGCGGGWSIKNSINVNQETYEKDKFLCSFTFEDIFQGYCLHTRGQMGEPYGKDWKILFKYDDDVGYDINLTRKVLLPEDLRETLGNEKRNNFSVWGYILGAIGLVLTTIEGIFLGWNKTKRQRKLHIMLLFVGILITLIGGIMATPLILYLFPVN